MANNDEIREVEDFTYEAFDKFVFLVNEILESMSLRDIVKHAVTVWDHYNLSLDDPKDRRHLEREIFYELWLKFKDMMEKEVK